MKTFRIFTFRIFVGNYPRCWRSYRMVQAESIEQALSFIGGSEFDPPNLPVGRVALQWPPSDKELAWIIRHVNPNSLDPEQHN